MDLNYGLSLKFSIIFLLTMTTLMEPQLANAKQICGDALNEVLDLLCSKGFSLRIRPNPGEENTTKPTTAHVRKRRQENGSLAALRRIRRRIANDCCKNGCTYDDIVRYCL